MVSIFISSEKCGEKSLILLENMILRSQIEYVCKDDPDELILIMCRNALESRECQIAKQILRQEWNKKLFRTSNGSYYSVSTLFVLSLYINFIF